MARRASIFSFPVSEFAAGLIAQREVGPRAQLTAEQTAQLFPDTSVVVYVIPDQENPVWAAKSSVGEIAVAAETDFHRGTLGALAESGSTMLLSGDEAARDTYAHLDVRRQVVSLAYVPLRVNETLIGAIELIHYEEPLPEALLEAVQEIAALAAPAIAVALNYENERNDTLQSISRVTQMYDLEKVFNSTLEMDELLNTIAKKFRDVIGTRAVNLWMISGGDTLELISREGFDPTVTLGMTQNPGEGIPGDVSDNGEPVLIDDPHDERLKKRNAGHEDFPVFSLIAGALMERENLVGVVEAVNNLSGRPFDDDDQFLLLNMCETASNALHNASLLQTERKVEILQTLVQVSGEITSTLNLDRVLQTVVNQTQAIIPFDRAAIALEQRGALQLRAVSGMAQINPSDPVVVALKNILEWASISNEEIHIRQHGDKIDDPRHETQAKFAEYFAGTGMNGFYALPLIDDQGRLGILSFQAADPDFLTVAHLEIIKVLASQATVALRNASLYREVPFIDVLEPLLHRKKRFMAMEKRRRALMIGLAAALALFLVLCPWPMRVSGDATVSPANTAQVQSGVDGVIKTVLVREGDRVSAGAPMAQLEDWDYRAEVASAQARYSEALQEMSHDLAQNDGTRAGTERVKADYWRAALGRAQERLDRTILRAPFAGVVTTPHVENAVGRRLAQGDTFAEIVATSPLTVDIGISEDEATLLKTGEAASVKLESFPTRTLHGAVVIVSPQSQVESDHRVFMARVALNNEDGSIRPGMQGRGKVSVGWHPAGYVFFRGAGMWIWAKCWSWFGW